MSLLSHLLDFSVLQLSYLLPLHYQSDFRPDLCNFTNSSFDCLGRCSFELNSFYSRSPTPDDSWVQSLYGLIMVFHCIIIFFVYYHSVLMFFFCLIYFLGNGSFILDFSLLTVLVHTMSTSSFL